MFQANSVRDRADFSAEVSCDSYACMASRARVSASRNCCDVPDVIFINACNPDQVREKELSSAWHIFMGLQCILLTLIDSSSSERAVESLFNTADADIFLRVKDTVYKKLHVECVYVVTHAVDYNPPLFKNTRSMLAPYSLQI